MKGKFALKWAKSAAAATVVIISAVCLFFWTEEVPAGAVDFAMDTVIQQTVYGKNKHEAAEEVSQLAYKFEQTFSANREGSEVDLINKNAGIKPVEVSEELYKAIGDAMSFSRQSDGVFDITVAPLIRLWGVMSENPHVPLDREIEEAKALVGYENIVLDDEKHTVFLKERGMCIDLGAIGKGVFSEMARDVYEKHGVSGAVISVGGEVMVLGGKRSGKFKIGVLAPNSGRSDYIGTVTLTDKVVSTSGDYERYFVSDGIRYHHIFDVRTGRPADSDLTSVTVIANNGVLADFLSTSLFIMGKEAVMENIDKTDPLIIAIDKNNNVLVSTHLANNFKLNEKMSGYNLYVAAAELTERSDMQFWGRE